MTDPASAGVAAREGSLPAGRHSGSFTRRIAERLRGRIEALIRRAPVDPDGAARIRQRYVFILPTRTGLTFGLVLFITLVGSLNYQNNLGLFFTFLLGSVAIVSMHLAWLNLLGLEVRASPGGGVFAGEEAQFMITLRDPAQRSRADLRVRGEIGRVHPVAIGRGEQDTIAITRATQQRGFLPLSSVPIETRYPLGLFRAWCFAQAPARVIVYPRPAAAAPLPPLAAAGSARAQGVQGEGSDDFIGPRSYKPGDSPRRLDWKALARERGLIVKQFGGDRSEDLWLDWERAPSADTEARLGWLCRQVIDAADADIRFGLRLPGQVIPLDCGEPHRRRCLEALASFGQDSL